MIDGWMDRWMDGCMEKKNGKQKIGSQNDWKHLILKITRDTDVCLQIRYLQIEGLS